MKNSILGEALELTLDIRTSIRVRWVAFSMLAMMTDAVMARSELSGPIQFNRDVLPILADKCFTCHGPDANQRKTGLRLDARDSAIAEKKGVQC